MTTAVERAAATLAGRAKTGAYLAAWRVVRVAPERVSLAAFERIADRVYAGNPNSVRRLRENLSRVVDEASLEATVAAGVRSYFRYWCESFRLPSWPKDDLVARTRTVGEQHIRDPLAHGRGVVAALPHMGNWDWAGAWFCADRVPLMTVVERLEPARLFDEFVSYRRSLGMEVLPLTGAGPPTERLAAWLHEGGLVPLLADRDLSHSGVGVELFGERARLPAGPAVLAQRTGADLLPVTLHYEGRDLEIRFGAPVEVTSVQAATQAVADVFTEQIRRHPQDWHMMQRVFEADLDR